MHVVNMACQNNAQGVALAGKQEFDQRVRGLMGMRTEFRGKKVHNMNIEILCMLVIM